jgi:predicted choloylglycine hydrolase
MTQRRQVKFQHIILKGGAFQIGKTQADVIHSIPGFSEFLRAGAGKFSPEKFKQISAQMDHFCPDLNLELQGLTDGLGIPQQDLIYYAYTYLPKGSCSHFALLPSRTTEGKTLVGRSYEFGEKSEDLRLCTMDVDGKYAFIGSSILLFGFSEGMNEHGLVITQSTGGLPVGAIEGMRPSIQDGFQFWFVIRAVLEQCKTVDEALKLIDEIPTCGNPNLIMADKSGQAALVEIYGTHKAVKRIDRHSIEQFICSTNHFTLPEMLPYRDPIMAHSQNRHDAIQSRLGGKQPVDWQTIKSLLSDEYPNGLACHYYDEFFGTLRSMIFDPQAGEIEVCFGSPVAGLWHRLDFNSPMKSYSVQLPLERMPQGFLQPAPSM